MVQTEREELLALSSRRRSRPMFLGPFSARQLRAQRRSVTETALTASELYSSEAP